MIQHLDLISLKQKIEGKDQLIQEVKERLVTENFIYPDKKFLYFDVKRIQKMMEPIFKKLKLDVTITQAWVHVMEPGASHLVHDHADDTGVYYLQVLKGSGNLIFDDYDIEIPVEEDLFILVRGKEKHSITKNRTKFQRITLAFSMEKK